MCSWNWRSWSPGRWVCLNRETKMNSSSLYLYIYTHIHHHCWLSSCSVQCPLVPGCSWFWANPTTIDGKYLHWSCQPNRWRSTTRGTVAAYRGHVTGTFPDQTTLFHWTNTSLAWTCYCFCSMPKWASFPNWPISLFRAAHVFFCARSINKAPLMPNWWSWMPMSSAPPGEDCGPPDGSMPVEPSRAILGVSWHHIWSKKRGILWMGQKQRVFHSCFFSKDQIRVSSLEHLWLWHLKKLHIPIKAEVINEIRRSMRMVVYPARMEI